MPGTRKLGRVTAHRNAMLHLSFGKRFDRNNSYKSYRSKMHG